MSELFDSLKGKYGGKKILVNGLGLLGGGVGIAKFFSRLGSKVTVSDLKTEEQLRESVNKLKEFPVTFHLGRQDLEDFTGADLIFKAPKLRWDAPEVQAALAKKIPVEMETSFFLKHCPAQVIGITGTRGKSTTSHLIFELLRKYLSHTVHLAGNLPNLSTISLLENLAPGDTVVLEVSSWQLSACHVHRISPPVAVFTSFYPDHLDYYKTIDEYLFDKKAIFMYQRKNDAFVVNRQVLPYLNPKDMVSRVFPYDAKDFPVKMMYMKGEHNLENAAAALKVAEIFNINADSACSVVAGVSGLPHRLQPVRRLNDVTFINDTTSTTPVATQKAIAALDDKPVVLILGGNSKNLPYDDLLNDLAKVSYIVLLHGSFTSLILQKLQGRYLTKISPPTEDLARAVRMAYDKASELGDSYVLFSPGATSFAMFQNEFHRGNEFSRLVFEL